MPSSKFSVRMLNYDYEDKKHLLYWPESVRLKAVKSESKGTMHYTMPGLKEEFVRTSIDHRFKDTFNKFFPRYDLDLNQRGLVWFIKKGLLDAALDGTSDMLTWMGQGKNRAGRPSEITQISMEVWALRFQLLLNLRLRSQLLAELAAFEELDAPDLYYQYKTSDKTGSLVPFSMRIIHAEALRFSPFPWKSLIRVEVLLAQVEKIASIFRIQGAPLNQIEEWEKRVVAVNYLHARVLHNLGEYIMSMALLNESRKETRDQEEKNTLTRALMRTAMQAGDERAVNHYLEKAHKTTLGSSDLLYLKSLRSLFMGSNSNAHDYIMRIPSSDGKSAEYFNTKAIAQLYTGRSVEAVDSLAQIKPIIPGSTTTNLRTIAELCLSTAAKDELLIRG